MIYHTDMTDITPEMEPWKLSFDETYAGRMAIWDSTNAVVPNAALATGVTDNPTRLMAPCSKKLKP